MHVQVVHRDLRADLVAGAEAEGVLQAALDDLVGDADVDHVRQVVLGRRLRRGQADRARVGADDGRARRPRSSSRPRRCRPAACSARRRAPPRASRRPRLDAGLVDVLDRHQRAFAALLARVGERAGHRVQDADLHRLGLGAGHEREGECGRGRRSTRAGRCDGCSCQAPVERLRKDQWNCAATSVLTHTLASMSPTRERRMSYW